MLGSRSAYTRARILDTAERLFAQKGHEATSLREITAEAQVNLSAVHYHFGSKEGLVQAVFTDLTEALNRQRIENLDQLELNANGDPLTARQLVEAYFLPFIQLASRHANFIEPLPDTDPTGLDVAERFKAAAAKALPNLSRGELACRYRFMLLAVSSFLTNMDGLQLALIQENPATSPADELTQRFLDFLADGLGGSESAGANAPDVSPPAAFTGMVQEPPPGLPT